MLEQEHITRKREVRVDCPLHVLRAALAHLNLDSQSDELVHFRMAQARTSGLLGVEDAPYLFSPDPLFQDVPIRPLDQKMIRTDQARDDALAKAPVAAPALADALRARPLPNEVPGTCHIGQRNWRRRRPPRRRWTV